LATRFRLSNRDDLQWLLYVLLHPECKLLIRMSEFEKFLEYLKNAYSTEAGLEEVEEIP
jgi:hypothetical protein